MQPSSPIFSKLDRSLRADADPVYRATIRDHFRSNVNHFYGVRMPRIREIAGAAVAPENLTSSQRWRLCDELVSTGIFEHKISAFYLAWQIRSTWTGKELPRFSRWLHKSIDDWMDTDDLCIRVIGEFFLRFPEQADCVVLWSRMKNRWSRRGSAVALIPSVRRGGQWTLVSAVCENLLDDDEALVAKACGWLLKDASRCHPGQVREFVRLHSDRILPIVRRTALAKL